MYAVTDSVYVFTVQICRSIIIWLEIMFTAYWFRCLPTVWHLQIFACTNFCPIVKCFMFGNLHICTISASFSGGGLGCRIQVWGFVEKSPLELCSYRLRSNHFGETSSCILTRRASRTQKTAESSTCTQLHYHLAHNHDCTMYLEWRKTVRWSLHKFLLIPTQVCHNCVVLVSSLLS